MRRRDILAGAWGAVAWPATPRAQQQPRSFRIGIISPAERSNTKLFDAFRQKMLELGYIEGQNITFEYRLTAGDTSRLPDMAADLVRMPVDVIVTDSTRAAQIALEATLTIPIVMATTGDAIAAGLAPSLAHPGGNATGFTLYSVDLEAKRLELLKEAFPEIKRVAAIWDAGPAGLPGRRAIEQAATALSLQLRVAEITTPQEIATGVETAIQSGADAIAIMSSGIFWNQRMQVIAAVAKQRLPAVYPEREYADDGGLLAYGPNVTENFRGAAGYVDKILKGAKPADLPIVRPHKFELVVNLKTAKALGLTIPQSILWRADEVIE
jgi:putative ABC transport system substrate-binding protein